MSKEISPKIHQYSDGLGHTIDQQVELGWLKGGQVKLSSEDAIKNHVAQFWDPRHHESLAEEKSREVAEAINNISNALTIRGVRRLAMRAYAKGAAGKPYQKLVQEAVIQRKDEIKSARDGQETRQKKSW